MNTGKLFGHLIAPHLTPGGDLRVQYSILSHVLYKAICNGLVVAVASLVVRASLFALDTLGWLPWQCGTGMMCMGCPPSDVSGAVGTI